MRGMVRSRVGSKSKIWRCNDEQTTLQEGVSRLPSFTLLYTQQLYNIISIDIGVIVRFLGLAC